MKLESLRLDWRPHTQTLKAMEALGVLRNDAPTGPSAALYWIVRALRHGRGRWI